MDWNLTRPILARRGVTHNRLAMKQWGHKLQLSSPVQVDVFKLQVATISKDMLSSRWLFWYCEFCAGLTPYSPFQSFSHLCGSKGTPQLSYTHAIPRVLGQDSKTCCFKSGLVCKIRFWLFQNSYCNCWSKTQFLLLPALRMLDLVAQDPDPCSFKPKLIPWFLASQHPDLSPAPIIFHIFHGVGRG